jgi:predicted ArsR family transcriptional regulator
VDLTSITPTTAALRVLAHPTRLRMLGLLRSEGPATATTLAARLGLNTGQTSYHLRQLAQHGLVVDDAERGNARDRWWRAAHQSTMTAGEPDDPDDQEAMDAYIKSVAALYIHNLQAAMEERALLPLEWRNASTLSDYHARLTPAHADEVTEKLHDLLMALREDDDEDAADFVIQFSAYPRPGQLGGTEDDS